jgi:hypothetical protein
VIIAFSQRTIAHRVYIENWLFCKGKQLAEDTTIPARGSATVAFPTIIENLYILDEMVAEAGVFCRRFLLFRTHAK